MSSGIETNKIVGAILTALLVTVGIGHFGAALFGSGGHGEAELAYPVAAGAGPVEPAAPEVVPTILPLLAQADAGAGEALFGACRGCHNATEGGPNGVGPALWDVVGRGIGSHEGYTYSDALLAMEGDWTYDHLNLFIHKPREYAPGTKMGYPGMPPVEDRANLIAYLRTLSNDPMALPTQDEIDAAVAAQQLAEGGGEATASDEAAADEATADEPAVDEATTEEPAADEATTEAPAADEATTEAPAADEATTEAPAADEATTEAPAADEATTEEPAADEATTAEPAAEEVLPESAEPADGEDSTAN